MYYYTIAHGALQVCLLSSRIAAEHMDEMFNTVVRTQGMRLMRPEKSWRPIVTVEVDKHQAHETVLGTDGQNPNLKETLYLYALVNLISSDTLLY